MNGLILPDLGDVVPTGETANVDADSGIIIYVLVTQIICSYLCYIFGKFACKIMIQGFSYAFPVTLAVPATLVLLISVCGLRYEDPCFFHNVVPDYLFFESPSSRFLNDIISSEVNNRWKLAISTSINRHDVIFSVLVDMVGLVGIANVDHLPFVDSQMRKIGYDWKTVREAVVRFAADRPVSSVEQTAWWRAERQNRSK